METPSARHDLDRSREAPHCRVYEVFKAEVEFDPEWQVVAAPFTVIQSSFARNNG